MITVIGLGFVGLTTALGFSEKGYKVYGYDINEQKRSLLRKGEVPFYEPFLTDKLASHIDNNFLVVDHLKDAVADSEVIFFCVGTPCETDGSAYLGFIEDAIKKTLESIEKGNFKVLVIKSTIPPSTTANFIKPLLEKLNYKVGTDIGLTNNPEFLREGYAWEDFIKPDRIVIGQIDDKSGKIVERIYKSFDSPIYRVSLNTAEFSKYLSNTMLATLISFANEQSLIARSIGDIDIKTAFHLLHLDKRWNGNPAIMSSYVYPGCGFGGYCLPKDTSALIVQSEKDGYSPDLLKHALEVNEKIKKFTIEDIVSKTNPIEEIGILGLSFKPNSNDIRNTPAKDIIEGLVEKGYKNITVYDPMAMKEFKKANNFPIEYSQDLQSLLNKVNSVVILTAWDEFKRNEERINKKTIHDYRYLF